MPTTSKGPAPSAVRVAPRDFQVLNTYAVYLCRENRYEDAAKYFDRAIRVPTNDYAEVTLTNAGVCMAQKPDVAKAEDYFRRALNHRAEYGEALLQMAQQDPGCAYIGIEVHEPGSAIACNCCIRPGSTI